MGKAEAFGANMTLNGTGAARDRHISSFDNSRGDVRISALPAARQAASAPIGSLSRRVASAPSPEEVLLAAIARAWEEQQAQPEGLAADHGSRPYPPASNTNLDSDEPRPRAKQRQPLAVMSLSAAADLPGPGLKFNPRRIAAFGLFTAGLLAALAIPLGRQVYVAETRLQATSASGQAGPSTLALLTAGRTMAQTVAALKLDRDGEFTGGHPSGIKTALDLIAPSGAASDPVSRAEASLNAAVAASADPTTGGIRLRVTTLDPDKSSAIADHLVKVALAGAAPLMGDASGPPPRQQAEADLAAFAQKNGPEKVKVALNLDAQVKQVEGEIDLAEQRLVDVRDRAERLKAAQPGDVLAGRLPQDLLSPALEEKLQRYGLAKAALAQLSAELGPRHPRFLARQAELDQLKTQTGLELARLAKASSADIASAREARMALDKRRNLLLAQARDTGIDLAALSVLSSKVAQAKTQVNDPITTGAIPSQSPLSLQGPQRVVAVQEGPGLAFRLLFGGLFGSFLSLLPLFLFRKDDEAEPAPLRAT